MHHKCEKNERKQKIKKNSFTVSRTMLDLMSTLL